MTEMTQQDQLEEAMRLLQQFLTCFRLRGSYICTRSNEGTWFEIDEDLCTTVDETKEFVALFD